MFHGTVWKPACLKSGKEASLLCKHFNNCGKVNNSKKSYVPEERRTKRKDIKLSISCKGTNLHYCETENSCGKDDLTEIFCDGKILLDLRSKKLCFVSLHILCGEQHLRGCL